MSKYTFVYSVDAVTVSGVQELFGMILDHPELWDTISSINACGDTVSHVGVAMYDLFGDLVSERDITHMCVPCQ